MSLSSRWLHSALFPVFCFLLSPLIRSAPASLTATLAALTVYPPSPGSAHSTFYFRLSTFLIVRPPFRLTKLGAGSRDHVIRYYATGVPPNGKTLSCGARDFGGADGSSACWAASSVRSDSPPQRAVRWNIVPGSQSRGSGSAQPRIEPDKLPGKERILPESRRSSSGSLKKM